MLDIFHLLSLYVFQPTSPHPFYPLTSVLLCPSMRTASLDFRYEGGHAVPYYSWLFPFNVMISRAIHVVTSDRISFALCLNSVHCEHVPHFFNPFIHQLTADGHLDSCHIWAIRKSEYGGAGLSWTY
jgi:hypothetical protein